MNTSKTIIGIDPGFTGGLALISIAPYRKSDLLHCNKMPLKNSYIKVKNEARLEIDANVLNTLLRIYLTYKPSFAVIEEVSASPQMGVVSAFRFGEGLGLVMGLCVANNIPIKLVRPGVWKSAMSLNSNKQTSLNRASTLWKSHNFLWKLKEKTRTLFRVSEAHDLCWPKAKHLGG